MKTTHIVIGAIYVLTGLYLAGRMSNSIFGSSDATIYVLLFFGTLGFLFVTTGILYDKVLLIEKHLNIIPVQTILGRKTADVLSERQIKYPTVQPDEGNINSEGVITGKDVYDYECVKCKSVITLDENEIKQESFICPVCKNINRFDQY